MLYEKIIHEKGNSFSHKIYPYFTMPWHYHPEFELIVITSGGGKRFVGDYIDDFKVGDLVLFGANLPHFHMCYGLDGDDPGKISSCEVIQFTSDVFPENMEQMSEFVAVRDLLERSRRGIKFTRPPEVGRVCRMMRAMDKMSGVRRVFALFRILEILGRMENYRLLASNSYSANLVGEDDNHPINRVYRYLQNNFKENVTLDQVAEYAGFNPTALCRYFKKRAQKSIFECLGEIRINFACKLLLNSTFTISQIAYESGFRNIANFNRQFRSLTGFSPSEYKELSVKAL